MLEQVFAWVVVLLLVLIVGSCIAGGGYEMATLRDELTNDPVGLGYTLLLAAGSVNQVATLLNEPRYDALGSILITPLLEWIAAHGIMARLRTAAAGDSAEIASIAEVALMLVSNPNIPALDLSRPRVQQMLATLTQAGVIPQAAHDELLQLATIRVSRAQQLGLGTVTSDDVSKAMEG